MADPAITIAGLGIRTSHLTPETVEAAESSRVIFYVGRMPQLQEALERHCPEVVDLGALTYREGMDRFETYKRMAALVVDAALTRPSVMLAMYGHPMVLSQPSVITLRVASRLGLRTKVLPAVSALDCLFADLAIDPIEAGLQTHEATELLLYRRPLIPEMATVLWQVGWVETRLYTVDKRSRPERLKRLRDHLLLFYPAEHPAFSVSSSVDYGGEAEILRLRIGDLPSYGAMMHGGTTLYIPPMPTSPVADVGLLTSLTSSSHLGSITE